MAWNGAGVYERIHNWIADAGAAIDIEASRMDTEDDSIAGGINNCITKDGKNSATANLPMGGFKHTVVANAAARNDYAAAGQIQDGSLVYAVDSGAANAYVITPSPAITAYAAGQKFAFKVTNANTGSSTLNVSSLGVKTIKNLQGGNLKGGELAANAIVEVRYDGTNFLLVSVSNQVITNLFTGLYNASIAASVASNDLTIELKTAAGNDASATDPIYVAFRSTTLTDGKPVIRSITGALSIAIDQLSSLGFANSEDGHIYAYLIDDGTTRAIAVAKRAVFDESVRHSTTALSASADNANTLYSSSALSNAAIKLLGRIRITYGATDVWDTAPTELVTWSPAMKKTGDIIDTKIENDGLTGSGATLFPLDDTIPQQTTPAADSGDEYMSIIYNRKSSINDMHIDAKSHHSHSTSITLMQGAIFQDSAEPALKTALGAKANFGDVVCVIDLHHEMKTGATGDTTIKFKAGCENVGTTKHNGFAGGRVGGGILNSFMRVTEIQA